MMTRRDRIASSLMRPINPSVIIILGVYTVVWGLWIISPFWTVFTQAILYSAMAGVGSEILWGCTAIFSGILIMRGAIRPHYKNLQVGSLAGFIHWLIIGIFYFVGDWQSTGGITCLALAAYCAVVWLNVKINKRVFK